MSHVTLNLCFLLWFLCTIFCMWILQKYSMPMFWLLINQTSNIICTVNNMSYPCDKIPAGFSYHTALRSNRSPRKKNPSHTAWNHVGSIVSCQIVPSSVARNCLRLWMLCVCVCECVCVYRQPANGRRPQRRWWTGGRVCSAAAALWQPRRRERASAGLSV